MERHSIAAPGQGRRATGTARIVRLSGDPPLIVEIVDRADRIRAFLDAIDPMMGSGLETVKVIRYGRAAVEP